MVVLLVSLLLKYSLLHAHTQNATMPNVFLRWYSINPAQNWVRPVKGQRHTGGGGGLGRWHAQRPQRCTPNA